AKPIAQLTASHEPSARGLCRGSPTICRQAWRDIVKTLIAALALVTLIGGPTFAETAAARTAETNASAQSAAALERVNTTCYNPYIGNWKHGSPRDDDSC